MTKILIIALQIMIVLLIIEFIYFVIVKSGNIWYYMIAGVCLFILCWLLYLTQEIKRDENGI